MRAIASASVGWLGLSVIGDGVPSLLLPHQLSLAGDGSATSVGLITLVAIGLAAAVQPVAGRWSDRLGRWPVILAGAVGACAGLLLLALPGMALLGTILALCGASVAQAGYQPILADRVVAERRGRGAGAKGLLDVGGAFIGFALLAALLGAGLPIVAVAVLGLVLVAALSGAYLLQPRDGATAATELLITPMHPRESQLRPGFVALVAARFLFLLGIYTVGRFLLTFVDDRLALDPAAAAEQAGTVLAVLALVSAAASPPSGWLADRFGRRPLMLAGGGLAAVGIATLPAAGSLPLLLLLGTCMALGSAAFSAGNWAALSDAAAGQGAGRHLGVANLGTAGAAAAVGAFGVVIDAGNFAAANGVGYAIAFGIGGASALAGGLLPWLSGARARRRARAAHRPPAARATEVAD